MDELKREARQRQIPIEFCEPRVIQKKVGANAVHQGVAAEAGEVGHRNINGLISSLNGPSVVLLLDQLTDPHNVGAIIRTAEALGVGAVILPEAHSAKLNATVAKVSAGGLFWMHMLTVRDVQDALDPLANAGFTIAATMADADQSLYDVNWPERVCLIIGNEETGIRKQIRKQVDIGIRIPQRGHVDSLNASVAAGISLSEICQRVLI